MLVVIRPQQGARLMTTLDFIIELFCRIDDVMRDVPKHRQAKLYPSEIVTLGILFALKGVGDRAFYRWLKRDWKALFPNLPHRTRLFRLFKGHQAWTDRFLAEPSLLGVADTYGIELVHPMREGRSSQQIGKKGLSNHRWIVGGKLAFVLNHVGLIAGWDCDTANVYDAVFHPLIAQFADQMVVLTDSNFHAKAGDPPNLKVCARGTWNVRMIVEQVLAMLTTVCHFKKVGHRVWAYFRARLAFTIATFNILVQWNGLQSDEHGFVHLSIAEFSL
jgi:hypothetical protein